MSVHAEPPPPIVSDPSGTNYATGRALGKGGFAICHQAERYNGNKPTGHFVALKIVKSKMEPAKLAQKFVTELQIHSKLQHPNVVTFHRAFSFQASTYVVLELCCNGSLADMLKKRKHLTLPEIRRFVIQICGAVKYLHYRHILHRDLKTGNLFLDASMNVKVGDFGLAALSVTEREMEVKRRTTMCGTPNYLAPEILEKGKGHDEKVDLWSIGVIAYTLAVGKAPFHASSKEEIYRKLKIGQYSWPELSETTNNISSDLREMVSMLLVPEELRPCPDKIVSHSFFRIAFVPANIPSSATKTAPQWPANTLPSAEVLDRGYSDSWWSICKESGVGEVSEGRLFPLNGGKRVRSVVHDMAKEAQAGRQPTMPIPKDVIYTSMVSGSDWSSNALDGSTVVDSNPRPQSRKGLREIADNEVQETRKVVTDRGAAKTDAELMPPPARPRKDGTVRKAARTISEETSKSSEPVRIASDDPPALLHIPKTRATPVTATARLQELKMSQTPSFQTAPTQMTDTDLKKPQRAGTVKQRGADANLARRPRAARKPAPEPHPLDLEELKAVSPIRKSPGKASATDVVEILPDREHSPNPVVDTRPQADTLVLPAVPAMHRPLPIPHILALSGGTLPGTDPTTILERLSVFRDNLATALSSSHRVQKSSRSTVAAESLPFVSRWVDYSRKHGIGYVLADGTVGCIVNESPKNSTPVTHVLVRNGKRWLGKIGKNCEHVDRLPLEVFEDQGEDGIMPRVEKGLGSVKGDEDRKKTLSVIWVKFGRYMCQSLSGEEKPSRGDGGETNFVRFYQRLGNVGIWAFSDGCLQVHFPDHTKVVVSADGTCVSATLLSSEAATYLEANSDLLAEHVNSRQVFADSISALLYDGQRVRARMVRANHLAKKLAFIQEVVKQWVESGGLGCMTDEKLYWEGLTVRDCARKVDRVTVGRWGGDDARL